MSAADHIARTTAKAAGSNDKNATPFRRPTGRTTYSHRMSLDVDDERYEFLRHAAWQHRVTAADLLRSAIDQMRSDPKALAAIVETAGGTATDKPPPGRRRGGR